MKLKHIEITDSQEVGIKEYIKQEGKNIHGKLLTSSDVARLAIEQFLRDNLKSMDKNEHMEINSKI